MHSTSHPPQQTKVLVVFFDLTGFFKFSQKSTNVEIFKFLDEFYKLSGQIIAAAGGKIVKFIGDAGLAFFPEELASQGVLTSRALKVKVEQWLSNKNLKSKLVVKVHFGPVAAGMIGPATDKRFDIIGNTVNTAATLPSYGFSMTPQAFRKLDPAGRKLFKKHTPAVRYIPLEEDHRD
ncbi:adenylate/guanylate cyclase domain-containing protein [candidate division CSSED10-310 bacterium]|uniref:Adenylate/guanylate cyclase domain-containing protein n=1 Tax=candidate division CSSED10-310 bacterium TaxID=2855610 RepID=A0ABV6YZ85_UNCC1